MIRRLDAGRAIAAAVVAVAAPACELTPLEPSANPVQIASVQPAEGSTFGGTDVTITGSGFAPGATVTIGHALATHVVVESSTTLRARTRPRAPGPADVAVTVASLTARRERAFAFRAPAGGSNAPPVIARILVQGPRPGQPAGMVDLGESARVTAVVTDSETDPADLRFEWTVSSGTVVGSGPSIDWRAPSRRSTTPAPVRMQVTVREAYTAADAQGLPLYAQHVVVSESVVTLHDSAGEVADLARDFLEKFSQSPLPADDVLAGFSRTCDGGRGYASERSDVEKNRCLYRIDESTVGTPAVTVNFGGTCVLADRVRRADACALVAVRWVSTVRPTALQCPILEPNLTPGAQGTTAGTDLVTAVYEAGRWRLCHSDYIATSAGNGVLAHFKR